jgi:hypothetical protein
LSTCAASADASPNTAARTLSCNGVCAGTPQARQCLYFCTSKASKLSTLSCNGACAGTRRRVSICTFVLVKQVFFCTRKAMRAQTLLRAPCAATGCVPGRRRRVSICTFVLVKQVN